MKPVIHQFTNLAPLYRKKLWKTLLESEHFEFHSFFGKHPTSGIKSIDFSEEPFVKHKSKLRPLKNLWVKHDYLIWQTGVLRQVLGQKVDLVILLGEFVIISNWLAALICRIRGTRVVFRGHGMYGNEGTLKLFFRKTFYRLASAHLLYERRSKKIMVSYGFDANKLHVYFNSLDYDVHKNLRDTFKNKEKKEVFSFFANPDLPTFIFVGRLTKIKKIDMVINAVEALKKRGQNINLILIGDGTEKNGLEQLATKKLEEGTYHFYGACYDENELSKFIATADLCVSPGNVGLTAVHSLSSGTPVCTHSNFHNQMPEVEVLEEGTTGVFFKENDLDDMVTQLHKWLEVKTSDKEKIRATCFKIIDDYYNPYYQEKVLVNLLNNGSAMI